MNDNSDEIKNDLSQKDDSYWREKLTREQYGICRQKGTEPVFTGEYWDTKDEGIYRCRCCGEPLFGSDTKYDSGSGWPSFYAPVNEGVVAEQRDLSLAMERTEIICHKCGSHLGHVFPDGPAPTGTRYCVNSASLILEKSKGE